MNGFWILSWIFTLGLRKLKLGPKPVELPKPKHEVPAYFPQYMGCKYTMQNIQVLEDRIKKLENTCGSPQKKTSNP